jgi:hypothetical protein
MNDDLPEFEKRKQHIVMPYITQIFRGDGSGSFLLKLIPYDDGHYRAVFKSTYFELQLDAIEPTKSQWTTLKKKMKRHDKRTFIFKQHGEINCDDISTNVSPNRDYRCFYVDFGFMLY